MKLKLKKIIKKSVEFIKSLNWSKEDAKKVIMFIIMLFIACFILNNFLKIKTKIVNSVDVDADIRGNIDAEVNIPYGVSVDR